MINIANFHGEIPILSDKLLPDNYAASAINCDLQEGQLKPTKSSTAELDLVAGAETIYRLGEYWLQWANKINVVSSLVYNSGSRIIYTGGLYPLETNTTLAISSSPYPTAARRLGIDAPAAAPSYSITVVGSGTDRDVAYVYTRVAEWADGTIVESAPSPTTAVFVAKDDATVQIGTFVDSALDDIYTTHYYIYRINTGDTGAEYQYVNKIAKATSTYDDTTDDDDLGEVLPTTDWTMPLSSLKGLMAASNGLIFGHDNNTVYVSETFITYAFPSDYAIPVESEIVGLGYSGNAVVVLTKTRPYMIYGTDPESLSLEQTPFDLPCKSARSIVNMPSGVIYASTSGLVLIDSSGMASIVTEAIFTKAQWEALNPETIFAIFYNNAYTAFFSGTTQGIEFKPGENEIRRFTASANLYGGAYVSTASINAYDFLTSASENFITSDGYQYSVTGSSISISHDSLYLIQEKALIREIVSWDSGSDQTYTWESKDFYFSPKIVFTAGAVVGDFTDGDLNLSLYIDGELSFLKTISDQTIFRLPSPERGNKFKLTLSGLATIDQVVIGQSVEEVIEKL